MCCRYLIPPEEKEKFEELAKKLFNKIECSIYLRHKRAMISPSVLMKHGIKFSRVIYRFTKLNYDSFQYFILFSIVLDCPRKG